MYLNIFRSQQLNLECDSCEQKFLQETLPAKILCKSFQQHLTQLKKNSQ